MKTSKLVLFILLLLIGNTSLSLAQSQKDDVDTWLSQIKSNNWRERSSASFKLYNLPKDLQTDGIKTALINEFISEYHRFRDGTAEKCISEENCEDNYYSWLYDIVSDMKDDRAFPVFMEIGSPTALAKYGEKGIEVIANNLNNVDCNYGLIHVKSIKHFIEENEHSGKISKQLEKSIKRSLLSSFKTMNNPSKVDKTYKYRARECARVRIQVIKTLDYYVRDGDTEVIESLKGVADKDRYYHGLGFEGKQSEKRYMVREEATKILEKSDVNKSK